MRSSNNKLITCEQNCILWKITIFKKKLVKRGVQLYIFENLFNVWFNRRQIIIYAFIAINDMSHSLWKTPLYPWKTMRKRQIMPWNYHENNFDLVDLLKVSQGLPCQEFITTLMCGTSRIAIRVVQWLLSSTNIHKTLCISFIFKLKHKYGLLF